MKFSIKNRDFCIALHDTPTAAAIRKALPIEAPVHR